MVQTDIHLSYNVRMEVTNYTIFRKPNPDAYFNKAGLDAVGLAKLEKTVRNAKDTLAIADGLEAIRNRFRDQLNYDLNRRLKPIGFRYAMMNIRI